MLKFETRKFARFGRTRTREHCGPETHNCTDCNLSLVKTSCTRRMNDLERA